MRADSTWIYFLSVNDGERIKVGNSRKPRGVRQNQHAKTLAGKIKVDLLCEVQGKVADEKFVQQYFAAAAIDGETGVFRPTVEIVEYIRWLRDRYFVCTDETTDLERESMVIPCATEWLPEPSRRKSKPKTISLFDSDPLVMGTREITGDDFYTNEVVIACAHRLMGGVDLDPASHVVANKVVRAERFYTISDNGLAQPWAGRVWLNPPFSAWQEWVPKVLSEFASGRVTEMCVLSAMRTVTAQYFAPMLNGCAAVCVMHGRKKFWGGKAGDSPDDGHAIFYFGQRRSAFRREFATLGTVFFQSSEGING